MNYKALGIGNISKQRENVQIVDKLMGFFLAAFNFKGEDRTAAIREIFLIQLIVGMLGKRRVIDLFDLRVVCKKFNNLFCVLCVTLQTKRQGFNAL